MPAAAFDPRATTPRRVRRLAQCTLGSLAFTVVLVARAGASTAPSGPAGRSAFGGSIGLRLVDVPVAADNDPRARLYVVDHLHPGTVIRRRIEVSNTTAAPVHVDLYSAAATIPEGFLAAAADAQDELSTWTSVRPGSADVPAGGRVTATVTIAVPSDASPGERYGVVWAEARSAASVGGGVMQVSRVGIRLYISVGPGGSPASNFAIRSLTAGRAPDGRPVVVASVHNTGGRALDLYGSLRLSAGPAGLSAGPFPTGLDITLAIGDTEPVTITLDRQLPAGPWDAEITLHSGLLERRAHATITFPKAGTSAAVDTVATGRRWSASAVAGVTAVLLAIAALVVVAHRRRTHAPHLRHLLAG